LRLHVIIEQLGATAPGCHFIVVIV